MKLSKQLIVQVYSKFVNSTAGGRINLECSGTLGLAGDNLICSLALVVFGKYELI